MARGVVVGLVVLALCLGKGAAAGTEERVIGEAGGDVTLTCRNVSPRAVKVEWFHGVPGSIPILFSSDGGLPSDARISLVGGSSLRISGLRMQDEGNYTCREVLNETDHMHRVELLVASGSGAVDVRIGSTVALPNGTRYARKHAVLNFSCASDFQPSPRIKWVLTTSSSGPELFTDVNSSLNYFVLYNILPSYQGNYSCSATNPLSGRQKNVTQELLVYYPPPSSPRCWAQTSSEGSGRVQLFCSWPGGYPHPTLQWAEGGSPSRSLNTTDVADTSVAALSSSPLLHRKEFVCRGSHILKQEVNQICTVQLEGPSVMTDPVRSCFVAQAVTMTCQLTAGNPLARITWLRNASQPESEIRSGGKFSVSQKGNVSTLVIQNCTHDQDEGFYVCKAENPVGLREAYVQLAVTKPVNIGGIVGGVVVLLLLGALIFSGILLYLGPRLCLKENAFRNRGTDDILVLVDSEEEDPLTEPAPDSATHQVMQLENGSPAQPAGNSLAEVPGEITLDKATKEARPAT